MPIPVHNVSYYRGDTYTMIVNFNKADGTPIDLSTGTLLAWIVSDPDRPLETKIGTGWSIDVSTPVPANQAYLSILPATLAGVDITETYYYDVQFKKSATDVHTFFKGAISIEPDITEAPAAPVMT